MISQFDDLVWQAADSYPSPLGMSRDQWFTLINSIIQKESSFNPNAVSWTGAGIGLMQVNPSIWLSVYNVTKDQLFDPWTNIQVGVQIIRDYVQKYGTSGGLGAYFAGPASRLTSSAQSYARTVLSIYSSIIAKIRGAFSTSVAKPGEFYFVEPQAGVSSTQYYDVLPENGDEASYVDDTSQLPIFDEYTMWLMLGAGLAILVWQER